MTQKSRLSYCAELACTHDYNRYLCALFAPAEVREAWFSLFAFHYEIAHIADVIGEEMAGFVRYAWWREAIAAICNGAPPRGHPVAEALAAAVKKHSLPQKPFDDIIDAHEKALAEKQELDDAFLEATSNPLIRLCALVAGADYSESLTELGVAFAAMEAANLRSMDEAHRSHFVQLSRARLARVGELQPVFVPFAAVTRFYLKRIQKGRAGRVSRVALPFKLWRRSLM